MLKKLSSSIQYLKGIGPKRAVTFQKMGISDIEDLLYYFPRRYEDRSNLAAISQLKEGEFGTIKVQVLVKGERRSMRNRRLSIFEVVALDSTGKISCVWFNQPYLKELFKAGTGAILYGKVEKYNQRLQMTNPEFEIIDAEESDADNLNIGKIIPVYSLTERITQRTFRKVVKQALDEFLPQVSDVLPFDIRAKYKLLNLAKSILNIHFPSELKLKEDAYKRLSFEEFFLYQIPVLLRKHKSKQKQGINFTIDGGLLAEFNQGLAFELTTSQKMVLEEIKQDMSSSRAMQRLLQGEVGSGKTIVACFACIIALSCGYQVAFMVPTEILAKQHYDSLLKITQGIRKKLNFKICLLTSSLDAKSREKTYKQIQESKVNLIIGTHALIQEELQFKNLGLVVIDEQHKFGVAQRALLPKKGNNPDILIMTATPIPRTLSMTIYGDLDISTLNELPQGRLPIRTKLYDEEQMDEVYNFIDAKLKETQQAFVIHPVIEESYILDLKGAKNTYEELQKRFKQYKVGLIHGQMKQEEQDKIMLDFKQNKIQILVATSILEVGIDVPNATVLVIEHAERFGLSQLHQLRGRIGRGIYQSYCLVISSPKSQEAKARINAIISVSDGFKIAEEDLRIRGPGQFFGKRQHGLTELKIADPISQMHLLKLARDEAIKLIKNDSTLSLRQNSGIKAVLKKRFPEYEKLMLVG